MLMFRLRKCLLPFNLLKFALNVGCKNKNFSHVAVFNQPKLV